MMQDVDWRSPELLDQASIPKLRPGRLAVLCLVLVFGVEQVVSGGDDDLPDLTKPKEMQTIVSTPAATKSATPKADSSSSDRAVLALPGITSRSTTKPASPASNPPAAPGGLQLDAPVEMKGSLAPLTPLPRVASPGSTSTGRTSRPLTLESPSEDPLPMDGPAGRPIPPGNRSASVSRVDPTPASTIQRRGRLFGLLPPTPVPAPFSSSTNPGSTANTTSLKPGMPGRSIVESAPKSVEDPAETALKKRIEKQVREAVGDRVRSIDVRVAGKAASVQAHGVKLFQKRAVRKSIESIPALSGLRSTIEVLD